MTEKKGRTKVQERKLEEVRKLAELIEKYPTVALLDITNLPARQLHEIRTKLKRKILIRMSKKDRLRRALEAINKAGAKRLSERIVGMHSLLLTELDSFELFRILKENQSPATAKAGQLAPDDIIIKAGPTQLAPGPIISTLGAAGIKAGIVSGKIHIKEDCVVAKKGKEISASVADVLGTLGIEPMRIGITLVASLEHGEIYGRDVLDIDVEAFIGKIATAHSDAWKLAIGAGILTAETVSFLILRAESEAKALALEAGILNQETTAQLLARAEGSASALKAKVGKVKEEKQEGQAPKISEEKGE